MSMWDIKTRIVILTSKIVLEDDFHKRMELHQQLFNLQDMLTEKMVKAEVNYKYLKLGILS